MILLGVVFFLFLFSITPVHAVTILVATQSASISSDIFNVDVVISGATNATNYLRVDLFKEGTTNYFGETYNGSDWYSGSDGKSYLPIQIQNASASTTLQSQIGNPSIGDYPGPGTYKLKIRRYTSSGSTSSNDTQTPIDVQITYSSPTATPASTPTIVPTLVPTVVPTTGPTNTPTPSHTPKPTPTVKPSSTPKPSHTPKPIPTEEVFPTLVMPTGNVLAAATENKSSAILRWVGLFLGGVGSVMIAVAASQIWQKEDIITPS